MINVLIGDDHKIVRMGLAAIVSEEFPSAIIFEAGNGAEILQALRQKTFDVMLMDLNMPDTDSFEVLSQSLILNPNLKTLVVSLNPERIFALRCLKLGAYGYIEKSADDTNIRMAVRKVANGKKYMSDDVMEQMTDFLKDGKYQDPFEKLGKQEFKVAMLLIKGLSNSEICDLMHLQSSTIATYKLKIFEKLAVRNVHDLMQLAGQYDMC